MTRGTREQVWNGEATATKGGLTKKDLTLNVHGKIVSKAKSEFGKVIGQAHLNEWKSRNK